ncbi:MAG: Yip1 family protein [Bacillota bacterium]
MGLLELMAGVLFDPVGTFRRLAAAPPLGRAVLLATLVNAVTGLMGYLTLRALPGSEAADPFAAALLAGMLPALSLAGFVLWYVKWFVYGGFLHFLAQLLGGNGRPTATLTVSALAALPDLFIIPVQGLLILLRPAELTASVVQGLAGLALLVWSVVLLILGFREVHAYPLGRAAATVLGPAAAGVVLVVVVVALVLAGMAPLLSDVGEMRLHRPWW